MTTIVYVDGVLYTDSQCTIRDEDGTILETYDVDKVVTHDGVHYATCGEYGVHLRLLSKFWKRFLYKFGFAPYKFYRATESEICGTSKILRLDKEGMSLYTVVVKNYFILSVMKITDDEHYLNDKNTYCFMGSGGTYAYEEYERSKDTQKMMEYAAKMDELSNTNIKKYTILDLTNEK